MGVIIRGERRRTGGPLGALSAFLPPPLFLELESLCAKGIVIEEIRLRSGRRAFVTTPSGNLALDFFTERAELDGIVECICDGSMYAHADTLKKGYVTVEGGVRVGIVGRASLERGEIVGIYDVSGICIRIPSRIPLVGMRVCELIRSGVGGALVYSPPAGGKTTLLRAVARALSAGEGCMRVVVVDERGELSPFLEGESLSADVLVGYPKADGIEIAARCMNAELIVCDEIGAKGEVGAIIAAQNCGVPLLATAHASDVDGLLRRTGIAQLHEAAVFGAYVGIKRQAGERDYAYSVTTYEEANERFKNSRGYNNSR